MAVMTFRSCQVCQQRIKGLYFHFLLAVAYQIPFVAISKDKKNFLILLCSLHVMFTLLRILLPTSSYVMDGYLKRLRIRTVCQLFILHKLNSMH